MDSTVKMVLIAAAVVVVVIGIGAFVFRSMGSGEAAPGGPEMPSTPAATAPGGAPQGVNAAPPDAPSEPR